MTAARGREDSQREDAQLHSHPGGGQHAANTSRSFKSSLHIMRTWNPITLFHLTKRFSWEEAFCSDSAVEFLPGSRCVQEVFDKISPTWEFLNIHSSFGFRQKKNQQKGLSSVFHYLDFMPACR